MQFVWAVDADGKAIVTIAVTGWTTRGWRDTNQPSGFALYVDGTAIGPMDGEMSSIKAYNGGRLSIAQSRWRLREGSYDIARSGTITRVHADAITWGGLAATYCRYVDARRGHLGRDLALTFLFPSG